MYTIPYPKQKCLLCEKEIEGLEFATNNGICNKCREDAEGHEYKIDGFDCWRLQVTLRNVINELNQQPSTSGVKAVWDMAQKMYRSNRFLASILKEFRNLLENLDDDIPSCENCEERRGEPEHDEGRD